MGLETAALIAAIAGPTVGLINSNRTSKKRNAALVQGILDQGNLQRQATGRINQQLDTLEGSNPDDEFAARSGQIRDQLRKQRTLALSGIQPTGGGEAVTNAANQAKGTATDFGDLINQLVSGVDAPLLQRQGEGFERADVGNFLNTIKRESGQQDFLTRLKVAGIRDNPLLSLLSTGLSAFGSTGGLGLGKSIASAGKSLANLGFQTPQGFFADAPSSGLPGNIFDLPPAKRGSGIGIRIGG